MTCKRHKTTRRGCAVTIKTVGVYRCACGEKKHGEPRKV